MRLEPEPGEQSQPYTRCMRLITWSNSTLRPRLIVPSLAMPAIRLSGTRKQKGSGLLLPMFKVSMPGGWGMTPHEYGGWHLNIA
ncbi:hypothetical protein ES707_16270 [subsurface metagenome]